MNFKINESQTKLRGGYYTHIDLASFLTRWVLEHRPKRVLEPSCGDGVFIKSFSSYRNVVEEFDAFEIEPAEAAKSRAKARLLGPGKLSVKETDFLEWLLLNINSSESYDCVVGNPPFIRYQYLDPISQSRAEKLFSIFHLPFTKHTNAWVPFVIGGIAKLRPGGRLGMVVPSEILHVLHAQAVREFLAEHCSRVLIVDPQELWFDALQGAVLLMAEKKTPSSQADCMIGVARVANRSFLASDPQELFSRTQFMSSSDLEGKWMLALLTQQERNVLAMLQPNPRIVRFEQVAKVDVGIVTGANKFFLVSDEVVKSNRLEQWSHPMFGRSEHARGVIYDAKSHSENRRLGLPCNFLWFKGDSLPPPVREYVRQGEREKLQDRYKCRVREPWYLVPSVYVAPVAMLKRCHHYPRLILNEHKAYTTDTAYRIVPRGIGARELVFGFVNSLTALSAELEGRHYGGGVLELVPSEIERLLIPVCAPPNGELRMLDTMIRSDSGPEEVLQTQDRSVLKQVGLSKNTIDAIHQAWHKLRDRRLRNEGQESTDLN